MTARSEQKEQRRKQILAAGLDLFIQKGLEATKVSDIADAVGMSVGLLFHYFESKEQLYEELVKLGLEKSQATLTVENVDPLAFFAQTAKQILNREDLFAAKMFVLMNQASNCESLSKDIREKLTQDNLARSAEIIRIGQEKGTIREGDPFALSVAFWGAVQGICQIVVRNPKYPRPDSEWLISILKLEDSAK